MPDVLTSRVSAAFGVRQAHVVSRMRTVTTAIQQTLQSEVDQLSTTLQRNRGKSMRELSGMALNILVRAQQRVERAIETQLHATAVWAYQSAVDNLLDPLPSEQLSWIALGKLLPEPSEIHAREHADDRFRLADAIELKKQWSLPDDVKAALAEAGKDQGQTGSATLLLKLLNAFPHNVPKDQVFRLVKAKVDATKGNIPPTAVEEFANYGGLKGRIEVGAPASLADWWQQGFHRLPAEQKKEILKQFVFPPPDAGKVEKWIQADTNAFGMQGLNWEARLQKTSKLIADPQRLSQTIANEIASGKGVHGVMQSILPQLNNYKVSAQRVARMEVNRICASANEQVFEDCGNVMAGVQINAVLDIATRPEHASRHGTIYRKGTPEWDSRPSLPDDYNCRCYYSPVLRPPKGLAKNPELLKQFENAAGPVMDPLVYGQWFGKATDVERQTVVGAKRYAAMAAKLGSVPTWSDFVNDQGNLRSLDQIKGATADEVLVWRAANDQKFAVLHDQLREIRQKSFLKPPDQDPTIAAMIGPPEPPKPAAAKPVPTTTPAPEIGPGWTKVTKASPSGKSTSTVWIGPDGKQHKTKKAALASIGGGSTSPATGPLGVPVPGPTTTRPAAPPRVVNPTGPPDRPVSTKTAPIRVDRPSGFPIDPTALKVVRGLGGSTGASLVEDADGNRYVLKKGNSPEHVREEFAAEQVYRAAGVKVPDSHLYEDTTGQPIKLSRFVEGKTYDQLDAAGKAAAKRKISNGYATDALLGNWDVVGANGDNVLIDEKGEAWRIDVGGSMRMRAQGAAKKGKDWNAYPTELWSLKRSTSAIDRLRADVFAGVTHDERMRQVKELVKRTAELVAAANPENRDVLAARLDQMADLLHVDETLKGDHWREGYRDHFSEHTLGYRNEGISDRLPKEMASGSRGYELSDENGRPWDDLRGRNSITAAVQTYIEQNGGRYDTLQNYFKGQAGSSWGPASQAFKYALVRMRGIDPKDYWWKEGADKAKDYYDASQRHIDQAGYEKTLAMYHAWTYESLRMVKLPYSNPEKGILSVVRTHSTSALDSNLRTASGSDAFDYKKQRKNLRMKEGPLESTSLTNYVEVHGGKCLHYPEVPLHRVFAWYGMGQSRDHNTLLYGDHENEMVCMLDGLRCDYVGPVARGGKRKEPKP